MDSSTLSDSFLLGIEQEIAAMLERQFAEKGLYPGEEERKKAAAEVAGAVADMMCLTWGGANLYIPKDARRRSRKIYEDFTGNNHNELALKYGVSITTIYKALEREKLLRAKNNQRQLSLLGGE